MIKSSALLVALAIGLLVVGVLASSLLMVYISIGVCAVAALILAAGVLSHWSEIFGRAESRAASMQGSWSAPQERVSAPVLASAGREHSSSRREDATEGSAAEVAPLQPEFPAERRGDDLWERVEEELGSAGKRDTGALSWPGIELPVPPESAGPPEQGAPPVGTQGLMWGSGAGWQRPDVPAAAWPPPAAAFAAPPARPEAGRPGEASPDESSPDGTSRDEPSPGEISPEPDRPGSADDERTPGEAAGPTPEAAPAGPARDADQAAAGGPDDEAATPIAETTPGPPDAGRNRPQWIISLDDVAPAPAVRDAVSQEPPPRGEAGQEPPARGEAGQAPAGPTADEGNAPESLIAEPGAGSPAVPETAAASPDTAAARPDTDGPSALEAVAEDTGADGPAVPEDVAEGPDTDTPATPEPAAEDAGADAPAAPGAAATESDGDGPPAPGRVDVTVVPGVARYHRSECILIRFLGAGDLEIMTRQEAEEAKFVPCRACQPDQLEG